MSLYPTIITDPNIPPRRALDPELRVNPLLKWITPEVRAEVDNWLMDRFGSEPMVLVSNGSIYCHPSHEGEMRRFFDES